MKVYMTSIVLLFLHSHSVQAQNCLVPNDPSGRDVPFSLGLTTTEYLPARSQAIVESYRLTCRGQITTWWAYISSPTDSPSSLNYTFTFQVWRKAQGYDSSGCYGLVGSNMFDNPDISSDGLVMAVPREEDYITAIPGDVIGIYSQLDDNSTGGDNQPKIKLDVSYQNETVWYHQNLQKDPLTYGSNPCYFSVGSKSGQTLHSYTPTAPLLSVNIAPESSYSVLPTSTSASTSVQDHPSSTVSTLFHIPTTQAVGPGPISLQWWIYLAAGVAAAFILLLLLLLLILILICSRKKKKEKKGKGKKHPKGYSEQADIMTPDVKSLDEPIYAEIDGIDKDETYAAINSMDVEVVGIEVVANESYAMLASNSIMVHRYGTLENDTDFHVSGVDRN